ncbi:gamma-butyrobetaine hydroxylase-like domain-containing protein, partial [Rhizobium ruizarguesonis]
LRFLSPSAEVQVHGPVQKLTVPGKRNVAIISMMPTGNYSVRIGFDDIHDTGIYTWTYLRELGRQVKALTVIEGYHQPLHVFRDAKFARPDIAHHFVLFS